MIPFLKKRATPEGIGGILAGFVHHKLQEPEQTGPEADLSEGIDPLVLRWESAFLFAFAGDFVIWKDLPGSSQDRASTGYYSALQAILRQYPQHYDSLATQLQNRIERYGRAIKEPRSAAGPSGVARAFALCCAGDQSDLFVAMIGEAYFGSTVKAMSDLVKSYKIVG